MVTSGAFGGRGGLSGGPSGWLVGLSGGLPQSVVASVVAPVVGGPVVASVVASVVAPVVGGPQRWPRWGTQAFDTPPPLARSAIRRNFRPDGLHQFAPPTPPCELHMTEEEIQPWKKKSTLTLQGPGGSPTITLV